MKEETNGISFANYYYSKAPKVRYRLTEDIVLGEGNIRKM